MSTEEDILIQDFLKNKLSENDRNEVLLKMENDKVFLEKVNFEEQLLLNLNTNDWSLSTNYNHEEVKDYKKLLRSEYAQNLKKTISNSNTEYQIKQKKKNRSWFLYTTVAAAMVVIISFSIFSTSNPAYDKLYASYLNLSDLPSLVNRGNNKVQLLTKTQKLFKTKKYNQALEILTTNFSTPQENKAAIYLYTGISQMELNKFNEAEKTFNILIESKLIDASKGKWYKALLFIKKNKPSKAKKVLLEIVKSSENYKFKEASELLNKL